MKYGIGFTSKWNAVGSILNTDIFWYKFQFTLILWYIRGCSAFTLKDLIPQDNQIPSKTCLLFAHRNIYKMSIFFFFSGTVNHTHQPFKNWLHKMAVNTPIAKSFLSNKRWISSVLSADFCNFKPFHFVYCQERNNF